MTIRSLFCLSAMIFAVSPAFAEQPEKLLGLTTDFRAGSVTIEVAGSGCTDRDSFRVEFSNQTLTVYRVIPDNCKAMPAKEAFTYSLKELGISPHKPFTVGNPFIVNENLTGL